MHRGTPGLLPLGLLAVPDSRQRPVGAADPQPAPGLRLRRGAHESRKPARVLALARRIANSRAPSSTRMIDCGTPGARRVALPTNRGCQARSFGTITQISVATSPARRVLTQQARRGRRRTLMPALWQRHSRNPSQCSIGTQGRTSSPMFRYWGSPFERPLPRWMTSIGCPGESAPSAHLIRAEYGFPCICAPITRPGEGWLSRPPFHGFLRKWPRLNSAPETR